MRFEGSADDWETAPEGEKGLPVVPSVGQTAKKLCLRSESNVQQCVNVMLTSA